MTSRLARNDGAWRTDRVFLLIAAVSFVAKMVLVSTLPHSVFLDESAYRNIALSWLAKGTYPTLFRPPLYPALVTLSYAAGLQTMGIRLLQVVLSILTLVPVYRITSRNYGEKPARVAAALVAFNPVLIMFSNRLWSETVFILLQMVIIDLLTSGKSGVRAWALAGVLFGFAALTRPAVLTTLPLILLWTLLQAHRDGRAWSRWSARYGVLVATCFVVILPWTVRNMRATGDFVLIDTNGPFNILVGTQPDAAFVEKDDMWTDHFGLLPDGFYASTANAHPAAAQAEALAIARQNVADDPSRYVLKSLWEAGHLWTADSFLLRHLRNSWFGPVPQWLIAGVTIVSVGFFVTLVLAGVAGLATTPVGPYRGLALLLLIHSTVFFGLVFSLSRYLLPLHPVLAIPGGATLVALRPTLRELTHGALRRRVLFWSVFVALVGVWISGLPKLVDMVTTGGSHYPYHRSEKDSAANHPGDGAGH
jgi:4-amino-4-deoxy-L-arabinose transferase-like glycosyltransferase